jgi:hypothetical protein
MSVNCLDSRELPQAWPSDIRRATESARGVRANPLLKTLIEGLIVDKCCGASSGFSEFVAMEYVRKHLGDSGLETYRSKLREGLDQAADLIAMRDSFAWKVSPLTVALVLTHDFEQLYSPAPHVRLISDAIVDAANGTGENNLAVSMPPRFGKSQLAIRYAMDWFLSNYPGWPCICVCATDELANDRGREVKGDIANHADRFGFALAVDSKASGRFNTSIEGGAALFTGIFGQIAGRGAAFMGLDDVFKGDVRQISNPMYREQIWDMWGSVLQTRLQSGAIMCNVGTRYHSEDLIGLMLKGKGEVAQLKMRYICLPALAVESDELGRMPGEPIPLGPVQVDGYGYTREALEERKAQSSQEVWASTYMQTPLDETAIGLAYSNFVEAVHCSPKTTFDDTFPQVHLGLDFNVDHFSVIFLQARLRVSNDNGQRIHDIITNTRRFDINVFRDLQLSNTTTYAACTTVCEILKDLFHGLPFRIIIAGDASGRNRQRAGETQVPSSDWSEVGKAFAKAKLKFSIQRFGTNRSIRERVNRTQMLLRNASGESQLTIAPCCKALIADLKQVRWKKDVWGNPVADLDKSDPARSHASDALDYVLRVIIGDGGNYGLQPERSPFQ